ncbi:hypothetical protein QJS10_CPA01g01821 [Acorus calamus]|uniref:Uncharacterized protein n=1 Tax=Acorus calamus TaxID=4465 RepID=A0AAV9FIB6_ACOCL|nr:hypothetical protein QJS10_CPA01g01821 [Acorus calamus]
MRKTSHNSVASVINTVVILFVIVAVCSCIQTPVTPFAPYGAEWVFRAVLLCIATMTEESKNLAQR